MRTNERRIVEVDIPKTVGKAYGTFWNFKGRYIVNKGSRASKKSKTTPLMLITKLMNDPNANLLVVRKVFNTLRDSCYADLLWALNKLQVRDMWECKTSPLTMTYKPTGQKIIFRGLDDPLKLTSVTVEKGFLNLLWIEEAYEVDNEDDFNTIDESIRGDTGDTLKQVILTFNPWNERHWLKSRFFDIIPDEDYKEYRGEDGKVYLTQAISEDGNVLARTTNFRCNEFLDEADLKLFLDMEKNRPSRFKVAGEGHWGVSEGQIYENYVVNTFDIEAISKQANIQKALGLDYGYTDDPTALFCSYVDHKKRKIYVFDEIYKTGLLLDDIANEIKRKGYDKETIVAEVEPRTNDELKKRGITRLRQVKKGKVIAEIDAILPYDIIVHPQCVNFIMELENYIWDKDKLGNKLNTPRDKFNHLMDAMRYAIIKNNYESNFQFG